MASQTLMEQFNFTAEDLAANERGTLTAAQISRARQSTMIRLALVVVLVIATVGGAAYFFYQWLAVGNRDAPLPAVVLGLVGLGSLIGLRSVLGRLGTTYTVRSTNGPADLKVMRERGSGSNSTHVNKHRLFLGGQRFDLGIKRFEALEQGASYTVYYIPELDNFVVSIRPD